MLSPDIQVIKDTTHFENTVGDSSWELLSLKVAKSGHRRSLKSHSFLSRNGQKTLSSGRMWFPRPVFLGLSGCLNARVFWWPELLFLRYHILCKFTQNDTIWYGGSTAPAKELIPHRTEDFLGTLEILKRCKWGMIERQTLCKHWPLRLRSSGWYIVLASLVWMWSWCNLDAVWMQCGCGLNAWKLGSFWVNLSQLGSTSVNFWVTWVNFEPTLVNLSQVG